MDVYGSMQKEVQIYPYSTGGTEGVEGTGTGGGAGGHRFFCPVCQEGFHKKNRMEQHKMVQHEGRRFYCDFCGKGFTRTDILKNHRIKEHNLH